MAAPNIVQVSTITAKTNTANLTTNTATMLVSNPASSGKVLKVNSIILTNANTTSYRQCTVSYYTGQNITGSQIEIIKDVSIPNSAMLIVIDKNSSVYLEENTSIGLTATTANTIKAICSFEEIS